MPVNPIYTFRANRVDPYRNPDQARSVDVTLAPGTYAPGTIIGQITGANTNDVQTLTVTATGGTYRLYLPQASAYTAQIAFNANAAAIQAAILAVIGAGNAAVTGTGPYVITAAGTYANQPIAPISADNTLAAGGTASVAHTTTGIGPTGAWAAYAAGNTDGSQNARRILTYGCQAIAPTDPNDTTGVANITYFSEYFRTYKAVPAFINGEFLASDLTGLDAGAVTAMGARFEDGFLGSIGAVLRLP